MTVEHTSPAYLRIVGHITYLRHQQRDEAIWASSFPWCYSPTAQLIWSLRSDHLHRLVTNRIDNVSTLAQNELTYSAAGPPEKFDSETDVDRHCIDIWTQSSLQLNRLCTANGIRYFHFLQPNQYVPDSKPIGTAEAKVAFQTGNAGCEAVARCFPAMRTQTADQLRKSGEAFFDLTTVFADHPEPLYVDDCCHVKAEGDFIMAKAIAAHIGQWMREHRSGNHPD
jgi:hypothetical protein